MQTPIYIPTRGRLLRQYTLESIGDENHSRTFLVCPTDEVEAMQKQYPKTTCLDRGLLKTVSDARQFILIHALENNYEKIIMLDDDLVFYRRKDPKHWNLRNTYPTETSELFKRITDYLDEYAQVGVSPRHMNHNYFPDTEKLYFRQSAVHGIRPKVFDELGIDYNTVDLMEDYYATLKLLTSGKPNLIILDWTWDQKGISNDDGGCSSYRTLAMQEEASRTLAGLFPNCVRTIEKTSKTGWKGMENRLNVRVLWKKAARQGGCLPAKAKRVVKKKSVKKVKANEKPLNKKPVTKKLVKKEVSTVYKKQDDPFAIQIELVEGCNLACSFCGIQAIRENKANGPKDKTGKSSGPFEYISEETVDKILKDIVAAGWTSRIEFAMHGEPSLHPEFIKIVSKFRQALPNTSLMMTSNGAGFLKNTEAKINEVMEAGLNVLFLDNYEGIRIVDKIQERYTGPYEVLHYPENRKANPHKRRRPSEHHIVVGLDPVTATKGNHSQISNHAGSAFPLNRKAANKRCAKPFRELSIRWDGNIALCCNDWPGEYKCGNLHENSLKKIWQNDAFFAARSRLYYGRRDFGPCNGCDNVTLRNGILPDRKGLQEMKKPGKRVERIIQESTQGLPYTQRIKPVFDFIDPKDK